MKTWTTYQNDIPRIINNSDSDNILWASEVINDTLRYLTQKYYFNERSFTTTTVAQQQFYDLPYNVKKLINVTVNIGGILWIPKECPSRDYWDSLNVIQFYQDFPSFFFVYNNQVGLFPNPASSGNTITMNYKIRLRDLSVADYTTGTVSVTSGSATVIGSGTSWYNDMVGRWLYITPTSSNTTSGDGGWYQIESVASATSLTLVNNYAGNTLTGGTYKIGEVPLLHEDYQDLPLYRLGIIYYTTRFPDPVRAKEYKDLYDEGFARLNDEFGSKTTNVVLTDTDAPVYNPNLFVRDITQS